MTYITFFKESISNALKKSCYPKLKVDFVSYIDLSKEISNKYVTETTFGVLDIPNVRLYVK